LKYLRKLLTHLLRPQEEFPSSLLNQSNLLLAIKKPGVSMAEPLPSSAATQ
jgi:hypothetical protein